MQAPLENLFEAAKVAKSFLSDLWKHGPLVLSSATTLSGLYFLCVLEILPADVLRFTWLFGAGSAFLWLYVLWTLVFTYRHQRAAIWHLKLIGVDEKLILREMLEQNRSCRTFGLFNGPCASLIGKGILGYACGSFYANNVPVLIQPHVMRYLRSHPGVVGLKKEEIGSKALSDDFPEATFEDPHRLER